MDHDESIFNDIRNERLNQKNKAFGGDTDQFDQTNTHNDWVSYITNYAGCAADTIRNENAGHDFREHMVKVAALAVAAIESHDNGNC